MIKKDIFSKKVQDYTFSVLFFLIFSFSIFFIIRPTLKTLFSLKKQAKDLEEVDQFYDQKIVMIAQVQQFLENNREKLPLLKEAIPDKPNLAKVVDDLNKVSSESGFLFKKIDMGETSLKEAKEKKYNQLVLNIEGEADFSQSLIF
jgi:Tfp pilus assembly protein PilO